jgi:hypothetical protein
MKTKYCLTGIVVCFGLLAFSAQAQVIPNFDFENWSNGANAAPNNWQSKESHHPGFYPVTQSTDRCLGNYSVRLENKIADGDTTKGTCESRPPNDSNGGASFPINKQYRTLKGFYKFAPQNGDSALILAMMYKTGYVNPSGFGDVLSGGWCYLGAASVFTPFSTSDFYGGGTFSVVPDSADIMISAYKDIDLAAVPPSHLPVKGNSVLYVDALNFDTWLTVSTLHDGNNLKITQKFRLLPNSNNSGFNACFETSKNDYTTIKIFDMAGREQKQLFSGDLSAGKHEINFETAGLSNGAHLFVIASGSGYTAEKLTIQN